MAADTQAPFDLREWVTNARVLIAIGGLLNMCIITFGVRDLFSVPIELAVAIAAVLVLVQFMLGGGIAGYGLLGLASAPLYVLIVAFNLVLAVSGLIAIGQPDVLGRRSFEAVAAAPKAQIVAVADNLTQTEQALNALSQHSERRAAQEADPGGSCGPTGEGRGPVFRVRDNDRAVFASTAAQFARRAAAMRQIRNQLDAVIQSYTVARHRQVASQIDALVDRARLISTDAGVAGMRNTLQTRLAGVRGVTPDPSTGQLVRCPDAELDSALSSVLRVPVPPVLAIESMPREPNHQAAAAAYVAEVLKLYRGEPLDFEMWGLATLIALFPDGIFLLGIAREHYDRRRRRGLTGRLAERVFARGGDWDSIRDSAEWAAASDQLDILMPLHSSRGSLFGRTDFLSVPDGAEHLVAYLFGMLLADDSKAIYVGLAPASMLPRGAVPRPRDGDKPVHIFVLKHSVWRQLLIELMRSGSLRTAQEYRPDSPPDGEAAWQEAAE